MHLCHLHINGVPYTLYLNAARVHPTSQAVNALDPPTVTSWFHDTVAARLVVGIYPLGVRWNGTRFHTHSGTLLGSTDGFKSALKTHLLRHKGMFSASEALRDALYKSTTTTTLLNKHQI